MQQIDAHELGKTIRNERHEEARRARLARSARTKQLRRFVWTERRRVPQVGLQGPAATSCVPCPSPSV